MSWTNDSKIKTIEDKTYELIENNVSQAKMTRDAAMIANILVFNVSWQVDAQGRDNMKNAIETAQRQGILETETRSWILADNTIRETTAPELAAVLDAYTMRMDTIYAAYGIWKAGNKLEPFVI